MIKPIAFFSISILPFLFSISNAGEELEYRSKGSPVPARTIEEVLKDHTDRLMRLPGVVGIGQGLCDAKLCIRVFVVQNTPEANRKIPSILEDYPVVIEEMEKIRALPKSKRLEN